MKNSKPKLLTVFAVMIFFVGVFSSCSEEDLLTANITVNEGPSGNIGGDFTGNGGSTSRTINWFNNLSTADYNADITGSLSGTFNIVVSDAEGSIVLERTLNAGTEPDTIDGVTQIGEPGNWTVTITLTSFNGDGSYSLTAGN